MAADHGSELHLLRFMGRHRNNLEKAIKETINKDTQAIVDSIEWMDFHFNGIEPPWDTEWKGVDFLEDRGGLKWKEFWPDPNPGEVERQGQPSWDAIGKIQMNNRDEWLLIEAKAHLNELASISYACRAKEKSLPKIKSALLETYESFTPPGRPAWEKVEKAWLVPCYQKANRLACLHFLNKQNIPARLIYIYFVGDIFPDSPQNRQEWEETINNLCNDMGLPRHLDRVHELFLNVKHGESI